MDQEILVDDRIDEGEKLIAHLVRSGFDVSGAFWVLTSPDNMWQMYVASTAVEPDIGQAFGKFYALAYQLPGVSVASVTRLIHPSDPIAREALAQRDRRPGRVPVRYRGKRLGDLAIEEAYIYPKIGPMTRDEVRQTVMALLDRGGAAQPSTFILADGSIKRAIPIGMHLFGPTPGLQFELLDPVTSQRQVVPADDVINVR